MTDFPMVATRCKIGTRINNNSGPGGFYDKGIHSASNEFNFVLTRFLREYYLRFNIQFDDNYMK